MDSQLIYTSAGAKNAEAFSKWVTHLSGNEFTYKPTITTQSGDLDLSSLNALSENSFMVIHAENDMGCYLVARKKIPQGSVVLAWTGVMNYADKTSDDGNKKERAIVSRNYLPSFFIGLMDARTLFVDDEKQAGLSRFVAHAPSAEELTTEQCQHYLAANVICEQRFVSGYQVTCLVASCDINGPIVLDYNKINLEPRTKHFIRIDGQLGPIIPITQTPKSQSKPSTLNFAKIQAGFEAVKLKADTMRKGDDAAGLVSNAYHFVKEFTQYDLANIHVLNIYTDAMQMYIYTLVVANSYHQAIREIDGICAKISFVLGEAKMAFYRSRQENNSAMTIPIPILYQKYAKLQSIKLDCYFQTLYHFRPSAAARQLLDASGSELLNSYAACGFLTDLLTKYREEHKDDVVHFHDLLSILSECTYSRSLDTEEFASRMDSFKSSSQPAYRF